MFSSYITMKDSCVFPIYKIFDLFLLFFIEHRRCYESGQETSNKCNDHQATSPQVSNFKLAMDVYKN